MKKIRISALLLTVVFALCSCSTTPQESGQISETSLISSEESLTENSEENLSSTADTSSEAEASKPAEERVYVELNEKNVPYDENAAFYNDSKKYYAKTPSISVLGYDFAVGGKFINNRKDSFSGEAGVLIFKDGKQIKGGGGFPSDGGQAGMKFDKKNPAAGLKVYEMTQNGKKYPLAIATSVSYNTTDEEVSGTYTRFTTVIDGEGYFFNSTRKSGIDGISPESVRNFTDNPVISENTITDNDNGIRYTFDFETGGILIEKV
ncbi:MAG: hypothetical protein IJ045_02220 [Ruminiclostridium sp.]|nr:hypothetical protein [Ruminiclostridium sp.]